MTNIRVDKHYDLIIIGAGSGNSIPGPEFDDKSIAIIEKGKLPKSTEIGDIVAVTTTGAYCYTMSSNYNRMMRPAVVFVKDGKAKVAVKRETLDDLIRNDEIFEL